MLGHDALSSLVRHSVIFCQMIITKLLLQQNMDIFGVENRSQQNSFRIFFLWRAVIEYLNKVGDEYYD